MYVTICPPPKPEKPPEGPPEQPPVEQPPPVDDGPIEPIPPPESISGFCDGIAALRDWLVGFGNVVRKSRHIKASVIKTIVSAFSKPECNETVIGDDAVWDRISCIYNAGLADMDLGSGLEKWADAVSYVTNADVEVLLSLYAARNFIRYLDETAIGFGHRRGYHDGSSLTLTVGAEILGIGASEGASDDRDAHIAQSIRVAIVPLTHLIDYCINISAPSEVPSIGESLDLWINGYIDESAAQCLVQLRGGVWSYFSSLGLLRRERPKGQELARLRNREMLTQDQYLYRLRGNGVIDDNDAAGFDNLRNEQPGPSDLVQFAVRHVFEPDLLAKFGFNDERDRGAFRLDAYHHAAGLDYPIFTGPLQRVVESVTGLSADSLAADYIANGLPEPTWARAYWWSHWIIPPQTWAAQARFRLDETRDTSLEPDWMQTITFTAQDYNDLLRLNDYPPYFRDKMLAISYAPPQMRFLRVVLDKGQITRDQLYDQLLRLSMMPAVASKFADAMIEDSNDRTNPARSLEHGKNNRVFRSVIKAYKIGTITRDNASTLLDVIGLSEDAIDVYLNAVDSDLRADTVARGIRVIKRDYFQGATDLPTTRQLLSRIQLAPDRIDQLLNEWQLERSLTVKMASTGQLISWYSQGIIDNPTLLLRLTNLGWIYPDLLAYLAESELRLQKREATLQAAALRSQRANAGLIERQLRDARKQVKELQAELRRLTPVGRLIKWARQGSISAVYFENRLSAMDYPPEQIAQLWQEVIKDGPVPDKSSKYVAPSPGVIVAPSGPSPPSSGPA